MGRIGANTIHQFQVQPKNDRHQLQTHQEYTSQVVESFYHQQAETIEEIPPPSTELFHEDLYPEESQNEPSTFASQELTTQQQQSVLQPPPSSSKQQTSRLETTQLSQQNGKTQRPRKQPQPQSGALQSLQPSQHNNSLIHDSQPQAEAFPPPQSQPLPYAFPPAQDYYEPHVFPPTQEEGQAFPSTPTHAFPQPRAQSVPQAFPPAQGSYEPHGFPPTQLDKEDFSSTPIKAHAFPPPQFDPKFFPPQDEPQSFVPQNHCASRYYFPTTQRAVSPCGQRFGAGPQGTPLASPMPQTFMTGIPTKQLLLTESWKTGLFGCMEDPTNALITAFGQIAEIVDSGQTRWQENQALKQNMQLQQATMIPPIHQTMMG